MNLVEKTRRRVQVFEKLESICKDDPEACQEWAKDLLNGRVSTQMPGVAKSCAGAIIEFVKKNGKATSEEIRKNVRFRTKSDNPDHVIHSTLNNLKKKGSLVAARGADGLLVYSIPKGGGR